MLTPSRHWLSASPPWFRPRNGYYAPWIKSDTEGNARMSKRAHLLAGRRGPALPAGPLPSVGRPLHRLEVQDAVLIKSAVRIAGDDETVTLLQGVLLDASSLQRERCLPVEHVE